MHDQPSDSVDLNFVCMCRGIYLPHQFENERQVYRCNGCGNELMACRICGLPKSIWADDGDVCGGCYIKYRCGKIVLTTKQKAGIAKWTVILGGIQSSDPASTPKIN